MRNFGEFYNHQIETASTIVLSRTDSISQEKLDGAVALLREHNAVATMVTTPGISSPAHSWWRPWSTDKRWQTSWLRWRRKRLAQEEEEHTHHHDHEGCFATDRSTTMTTRGAATNRSTIMTTKGAGHGQEHRHDHEGCCHEQEHHHDHEGHCHEQEHHHDHDGCCHEHGAPSPPRR